MNIPLPGCGGLGSNSCPSYLNWGWYQPIISVKYNTASTNHQDARHDLDSLIDDGDTENFLNKILQSEGDALYSDLSDASPWLSDIVLLTLLDNENRDKLSEEQLVDILIQNGRLSETVYAAMLISEPVLSDESYRVLEENQAIVGVRELKEREWKAWMFQADLVAAELVTHALTNDSLDGAIAVLDGTTALPEMQKLFVLYLADQDTANAELELIDIVNAQQGKDNVWSAMAWVALDHAQEGRSWLNATLGEFELADSIWNANPEKEIGARSVVAYYRPRRFAREPFALESGERHGNTDEATSTPIVILPSLQLYPNPATNTVSVVVSGNSDTEMRLEVLNALGQKVDEIVIASGIQTEIDISGYASGMLYLRLTSQGIGLATEKLMIVR